MFHASKRSKFNGTLLLKCVVASCLLSGITAESTTPCPPTSTTCGCLPEIADSKSLLLAVLAKLDKVEAKVDKVDKDQEVLSEFVGLMPPSTPPSAPPSTPPPSARKGHQNAKMTSGAQWRIVALSRP